MTASKTLWSKGPFELQRRALTFAGANKPTIAQAQGVAKDLLGFRDSSAWAIGDLVCIMKGLGKEDAINDVAEAIVKDPQWVRKCFYVSEAVAPEHRHYDLWWNFYYAVYTQDESVRNRLLKLAEDNEWTFQEFKGHIRSMRRTIQREMQKFPEGQYGLIYADPPWEYNAGSTDPSRQIENQYPTMPLPEIIGLADPVGRSVKDLAAKDCILYLWATSPKLEEALQVLNGWGFEYRSSMIWDKQITGMGYWARIRHEILLIGVRGNPMTPDEDVRPDSIIVEQRGEHSAKPLQVYDMLEKIYPNVPRVEIFARTAREGWDRWGNEAPVAVSADAVAEEQAPVHEDDATGTDAHEEQQQREKARRIPKRNPGKNAPRLVKGSKAAHAATA